MTTIVAAANAGQGFPNGWPTRAYVRAARHADFRQLLAREEAGATQEEAGASAAAKAALAVSASPKALASPAGTAASSGELALASARQPATDDDVLDPLNRHRATLAPPDAPSPPSTFAPSVFVPMGFASASALAPEAAPRGLASLEHLVPALVRRVAWSGDARRGTARLEIGAGELAGSTLLVHADEGRVQVHLSVPPGVDAASWQRRIAERLASRNIAAQSVEVA